MRRERDFKSSSTSTILLNSTINAPNVKLIIKAVATLLHSNLIEDLQEGKTISTKGELYYFSEGKYINENPDSFDEERINLLKKTPTQEDISGFIEVRILKNNFINFLKQRIQIKNFYEYILLDSFLFNLLKKFLIINLEIFKFWKIINFISIIMNKFVKKSYNLFFF